MQEKSRLRPQFLRDMEYDGSIAKRAREIAKLEHRTTSGLLAEDINPETPK